MVLLAQWWYFWQLTPGSGPEPMVIQLLARSSALVQLEARSSALIQLQARA